MKSRNSLIQKAINGFKFTLAAQIIVLLLSVAKSIVLPKLLSIPDYGYWQVYVLYSTYVGIFALGYNDGIYLKYGKYQYDELPVQRLRPANRYYVLMLSLFTTIAMCLCFLVNNPNRKYALLAVSIDILLMGINGLLIYILQTTNQMKAYSFYSVLDKLVLLVAVILIALTHNATYQNVIISDVISKACVTISLTIRFRKLFFGKVIADNEGRLEFGNDIAIGINLMVANLMGMFVTGIGRFIIDFFGNISDYAYYSFGITITNLVLVCITAVSLVLYPTLKRLPENEYNSYFEGLNFGVTAFDFFALFLYFPAVLFINFFLPDYRPLLVYVQFLFGVIVLQAKMQLLNNTFYKVLREEKALLRANMICVGIFLILALISYYFTRSATSIAVCTFIAMIYRCYASEIFLRKKMGLPCSKDMWLEVVYIVIFALMLTWLDWLPALIAYTVMFTGFMIYSMPKIKKYSAIFERK